MVRIKPVDIGEVFGRLTAVENVSGHPPFKRYFFRCKCACGKEAIVSQYKLRSGHTKSCGCAKTKHGLSYAPTYGAWIGLLGRCNDPDNIAYKDYGERGIKVCKRWNKVENFIAYMGNCPKGCSLDRINNNGNYEPSNCRWATRTQQANNKRNNRWITFNGDTLTIAQWAQKLNISSHTLAYRVHKLNWPIEKALTTPVKSRKSSLTT